MGRSYSANKVNLDKIRLNIVTFPNCVVLELSYLTETGDKPLKVRLESTCSEFFKGLCKETFWKLDAERTLHAFVNRIKRKIDKIEAETRNPYLTFNQVKVLNKERLLLNNLKEPLYIQDVVIHFKAITKW